jgi:hypothetical protein
VIQEYQSSELLFEVEYRHPWFRGTPCSSTNWNDYREIEEVTTSEQIERGYETHNNNDENDNHRPSYTRERRERRTESPINRGPNTDRAPVFLND